MIFTRTIFDIGVNNGDDSKFYLAKGFRVVGVEANPVMAEMLRHKFADAIEAGRYILLATGIWSERSVKTFYRNLDNDHWSSFDPVYGTRNGTRYEEIPVRCITISDLLSEYGVPYYMKIDVEGADKVILKDLRSERRLPRFISVEEYSVQAIDDLHALGYTGFQIVPQRDKSKFSPPKPSREGSYVAKKFTGTDSGPFGKDLPPDHWQSYSDARKTFVETIRNEDRKYVGPVSEWHDVHAVRPPTIIERIFGRGGPQPSRRQADASR